MRNRTGSFAFILALGCWGLCTAASGQSVNSLVSPDLFGEQVDLVTPGFGHWAAASSDVVDPDGDANDFDNNFGVHAGSVDNPTYSSQAYAYGAGNVDEEFVYSANGNVVSWEFNVPGGGQYVFVTRYWREFSTTTTAVASYYNGAEWIDLPPVTNIQHWGGYGNLACYLIEIPAGLSTIPMRVRATSGRLLVYRLLLAKRKDPAEFVASPAVTHPSMHFRSADIATMRSRVGSGPPKLCYDYMVSATVGYINDLNYNSSRWLPQNSSHAVPRSIVQTAFVYVISDNDYYYEAVIRMIDKVIAWNRSANVITDQSSGYWNVLGRGRIISAIALAYDWMYGRMTPAERTRVAALLAEEANRLYLYNETFVGNVRSGNWNPWIGSGYGMVGVALRDEHNWPTQWVGSMRRIFTLNLQRSDEDFGYFNNGFTKAIDFGISLKTATGEDLFTPQAAWLTTLMDYRMTMLEPMGGSYPAFGDASASDDPLLALVAATYLRDPMAQWFINHRSCADSGQVRDWGWEHMMPVAVVTTYDPTLAEEAPSQPRLSPAKSFFADPLLCPGLSVTSVLRTGYGNAGDIQVAIRSGPYLAWHGHPCQGNFVLNAFGDRLVIDKAMGGTYGSAENNFSKTAEAHSQVLVDGKGQVEYSGPVYYNHEAGITGPLTSSAWADHVQAEMAVAYSKGPLGTMEHAYRDFLFIRHGGQAPYLVVLDDLKTDSSNHTYQWLLQTDYGNSVTSAGANHSIIDGSADMDVITIEPASITPTVSTHYNIWRTLKVTNPQPVVRGTFLTVLYPRPGGVSSPAVNRLEDGELVGFTLGYDLVLFHKGSGPWQYLDIETDGRLLYVDLSDIEQANYLVTDATVLRWRGVDVFTSPQPVTRAGTFLINPPDVEAPTITAWHSAANHGRGVGEALLEIPDDGTFSEPRCEGVAMLVLEFSEPMDAAGFAAAQVDLAGRDANGQPMDLTQIAVATAMRDDTTGEIVFSPALPDYGRYEVRIVGPTDQAGNPLDGDDDRIFTALAGDASGDLRVDDSDLADIRAARTNLLNVADISQVRAELSGDGRVNATDLSRTRAKRGRDATGIADP